MLNTLIVMLVLSGEYIHYQYTYDRGALSTTYCLEHARKLQSRFEQRDDAEIVYIGCQRGREV